MTLVDVSEKSEPELESAKKKTASRRVVKKKVTLSADDNIISDDPDAALKLAKSISQTEAEKAEKARKVHATHARIVTKSVPESAKKKSSGRSSMCVVIQETPSTPKSKPATSKPSLKVLNLLLYMNKKLQTLCKLSKKVRRQAKDKHVLEAQIKELDITEEKVILEWGDKQDSEFFDDDNDDLNKDDKDGDADDEGDDHVSDTQDDDDEDDETKSDKNEIYKYKIRVRNEKDVEMKDAEVKESDKGEEKVTDAIKEEAKKTSEAKDDTKKSELPPSSSSLYVSSVSTSTSTFGISPDVAELKDMVKALLLDKKSQNQSPATVKAVEENYVTCGGAHSYRNCPATDGNVYPYQAPTYQAPAPQTQGVSKEDFTAYVKANDAVMRNMKTQGQNMQNQLTNLTELITKFVNSNNDSTSSSGTLPSNTIANPRSDLKAITTRSALADLGARINLMHLSMWNKLYLPDLTPMCMTLELSDRLLSRPVEVAEDVYVKVGSFHFSTDFVVVDFDADPRVPLILRRSFLKTGRALIDVFKANYNEMMAKRIDVIDMACKEYFDFLLEEVDAFLAIEDDPTSLEVDQSYLDPERDILILEAFLNDDPSLPPSNQGNYLPEVELKDLPPQLEYAFLEGDDKFPVIIAKDLSVEEKTTLITVLKSHKRAIAWKLSDIKGIDPEFYTHKILMEEDFEPAV
nr:hypothetical protein [Tanacetum cinerariifolium]